MAFIYAYTHVLGRPPAEVDLQRRLGVSPPSVHQMVLTLERTGLINILSMPHASDLNHPESAEVGGIFVEVTTTAASMASLTRKPRSKYWFACFRDVSQRRSKGHKDDLQSSKA